MDGIIIIGMIIGAVIGGLIGNSKGRPVAGALLGFSLGFIGWLIALCLPKTIEKEAENLARLQMAIDRRNPPQYANTRGPADYDRTLRATRD